MANVQQDGKGPGPQNKGALMRKIALAVFLPLVCAAPFFAQQATRGDRRVADLLAQLHAEKWSERAAAYGKLRLDPTAIEKTEVRSALLDLLDRESHLPLSTAPEPENEEQYAEYVASLGDTVDSFADWKDPRQLCILAQTSYNTDSRFAARLAGVGKPVIPCLMQMAKSDRVGDRFKSVAVLIQLRAKELDLDLRIVQEIRRITIRALHDPDDGVREFTVDSLREFGGEDMIPALQEVAEKDPAPEVQGFSTRKDALKAIAAIQKRTNK
jgi:hypothetical protein